MTDTSPPAGWYPDPKDPWSERRWDGAQWTEDVRTKDPDDTPLIEEPTVAFDTRQDDFWEKKDQPAATTPSSARNRPAVIVIGIGVLVLAAIAGYALTRSLADDTTTTPPTSVVATPTLTQPTAATAPTIPATTLAPAPTTAPSSTAPQTSAAPQTTAVPQTNNVLPPAGRELPVDEAPFGTVDEVSFSPNTRVVRLSGWTMDGDARAPVQVTLFIDLAEVQTKLADERRADLAPIYRNGVRHGFTFEFELPPGPHGYCVVAENIGGGPEESTIFCETRDA